MVIKARSIYICIRRKDLSEYAHIYAVKTKYAAYLPTYAGIYATYETKRHISKVSLQLKRLLTIYKNFKKKMRVNQY